MASCWANIKVRSGLCPSHSLPFPSFRQLMALSSVIQAGGSLHLISSSASSSSFEGLSWLLIICILFPFEVR